MKTALREKHEAGERWDAEAARGLALEEALIRPRAEEAARLFDADEVQRNVRHVERSTFLSRREVLFLAGCVVVGFLLRLFALRLGYVITPDGVSYATHGQHLVAGNLREGLSTYWPPLYPMLVGLSSLVFRDVDFAGRFVSVVAGALVVVPVYFLARGADSKRVARLAALLTILHPLLIYYSTLLLTESTYTLVFVSGVAAGWHALSNNSTRTFAVAGLAFGASYLLKPEAFGFVLLLLALALGVGRLVWKNSYRKLLLDCVALVSAFLLLALPYLLYLRRAAGRWTISEKLGGHMWQGRRGAGDSIVAVSAFVPDASVMAAQLTKALRHEYEILNMIFPAIFVLVAGLGLFRTRWTRRRASRELYLATFVIATLAGYAVTLPNIRFLVPLLPLLLCWVARGVTEGEGWLAATLERVGAGARVCSKIRRLFAPLVVSVLLLSLLPLSVYLWRGDKWGDYYGQKQAAVWIKAQTNGTATPRVMSTVPVTAFYTGGVNVPLLNEEYAAFVERARRERVDFVIVNERDIGRTLLRPLLDEGREHPGLRLAHRVEEAPGFKILVYTLTDS